MRPGAPIPDTTPPGGRRLDACTFAVIDLSTTGFGLLDRVVEIGMVRFTGDGSSFDQWSTLVNPGRDLGAAKAHGVLSFQDLRHAPRFEDVAGDLVDRLKGAVVVAHSLQFERRFLGYEFAHLGLRLPAYPALCTLRIGCTLGAASRRLDELCRQFGIPVQNLPSALADAWSAARLLCVYAMGLRLIGRASLELLGCATPHPEPAAWPQIPKNGMLFDRYTLEALPERERPVVRQTTLGRAIRRLTAGSDEHEAEYLDLLDRMVEDFELASAASEALRSFAEESGFDTGRRERLHTTYFDALARAAWEDGVLSEEERTQIVRVGRLLGTADDRVRAAVGGPPRIP